MPQARLKLLLVADLSQSPAAMLSDSVDAFRRWSRHDVAVLERGMPRLEAGDLYGFDAVLIHYSVFVDQERHLPPAARAALARSKAIKLVWQQDEHRNVAGLAGAMADVGATIVLTALPRVEAERLYGSHLGSGATFVSVLTGYVSDRLIEQQSAPYEGRPLDIGYRGRTYPLWHGRLGAQRIRIAEEARVWAREQGLTCDISIRERDRLYGPAWADFLRRCKATLGTESGASVFDADGSLPERVWSFILRHPLASEAEVAAATYGPLEGLVDYAQISPRVFEAVAAGSLLLLTPGRYSGIVAPGRHAVIVEPRGRNAAEIADTIRDPRRAGLIIEAARAEILLRPDLHERAFVAKVEDAIEAEIARTGRGGAVPAAALARALPKMPEAPPPPRRRVRLMIAALLQEVVTRFPGRAGRYFDALLRMALLKARRIRLRAAGRRP
jgi:hypothetical protein